MAREKDKNLRTQVRLGYKDLELHIKTKGDKFWNRVDPTRFSNIPEPDLKTVTISPPMGRPKMARNRSESVSPNNVRKRINMDDPFGEEMDAEMIEGCTGKEGTEN